MANEILEEIWRTRDELAKRFNYDLDAMIAFLREVECQPGSQVVNREETLSQAGSRETNGR
ncbi:MAG: hypothetical protein HYV26_10815 [Candidatus Hydrogenedentes bacterium]|nr:hypothetical protein [Candidatus Hydrogenedentota bacterium]MBI3117679.1 hypothetical protein [Candidatus Hydrogenedentota bacterium]